jgi:hypothetical protein
MANYVNDQGQPDPNGNWELIDGKQILRDGYRTTFSLMMMDSAPAAPMITDAAIAAFRASPAGQEFLARERYKRRLSTPRDQAFTWDAAQEPALIAAALTAKAPFSRTPISDAVVASAQASEAAARTRQIERMTSANR